MFSNFSNAAKNAAKIDDDDDRDVPFLVGKTSSTGPRRHEVLDILNQKIIIDDKGATVVMIFPKGKKANGTIDEDEILTNVDSMLTDIFVRKSNAESINTLAAGFENLIDDKRQTLPNVTMRDFQEAVRKKMLCIFENSGIWVESFESADADEHFLKLDLDSEGETMKMLAQRYNYRMPFTEKAYREVQIEGKPVELPVNANGALVPAYAPFRVDMAEHMQPFRQIDEIRLMQLRLSEWMHLENMVKHGVLSGYFVASNFMDIKELNVQWSGFKKMLTPPLHYEKDVEHVRNFFGERIAFFFLMFGFYVKMLLPLAVFGGICFLRKVPAFGFTLFAKRMVQIFFSFVMIIWVSVFLKYFHSISQRYVQQWGMKDCDGMSPELNSYIPGMEGTWTMTRKWLTVRVVIIAYVTMYIGVIGILDDVKQQMDPATGHYIKYCVVAWVKIGGFLWGKIAPWLAGLENPRTTNRFDDNLTWILGLVKLLIGLYPFVNISFLNRINNVKCGANIGEAAHKAYGIKNIWPIGIPENLRPQYNSTEGFVKPFRCLVTDNMTTQIEPNCAPQWMYTWQYTNHHQVCLQGCVPHTCYWEEGQYNCVTNCVNDLIPSLYTLYVINVGVAIATLLIPILLIKRKVREEIQKADEMARESADFNPDDNEHTSYSFLQFQAKSYEIAKYEYDSNGGCYVGDFMDLAVNFALLTCFGLVAPIIAVICFVAHIILYRLFAYRFTNVTCRPDPLTSDGIGTWSYIFETIAWLAVLCNTAFICFVMFPIRSYPLGQQLAIFVFLEHAFLFIRYMIVSAIPDVPHDVINIEDDNEQFLAYRVPRKTLVPPKHEKRACGHIDLGLS